MKKSQMKPEDMPARHMDAETLDEITELLDKAHCAVTFIINNRGDKKETLFDTLRKAINTTADIADKCYSLV